MSIPQAARQAERGLRALVEERGYLVLYRPAETNRCPGCGGGHWYVGRATAECAGCATAIALAPTETSFEFDTIKRASAPDQE